jgi:TonB family protein
LIVDYEPRNVAAASGPLEKAGYKVEIAADGVAGLRAFEKLAPALVLIEAMLPKKHGFEVCQEIKKTSLGKRTPVVITTAVYRGRKYRTQALHIYGADEYLEKPFTGEQILEVCVRFLGEPPGAAPAVEEQPVAVNQGVAGPPTVSATPTASEPTTDTPGTFSKIVGDLTEEEITERLDSILPGELSDPVAETPVPAETDEVAPAPSDGGIVNDLPPDFAEGFIATEQPASISPAEPPVEREAEPESVEAAEPVPEDEKEEPAKTAAEPTIDAAEEPQEDAAPLHETATEVPSDLATTGTETDEAFSEPSADDTVVPAEAAPEPEPAETVVAEEAPEPQPEQAASEEKEEEKADAEPKSEAEELADAVSAAIDQMQAPGEPEAESAETEEQVAAQELIEEETTETPEVEAQAVEDLTADEPVSETPAEKPLEEVVEEAPSEAAETPPEPAKRRKTGLWMGVAAVLVVGIAVTLFFALRGGGDGVTPAVATPEPIPAPTSPSSSTETGDVAGAAMVLGTGSETDAPEAETVVAAGTPTAKPVAPVTPAPGPTEAPAPADETGDAAPEPATTRVEEEPTTVATTEQEDATGADETEQPEATVESDDAGVEEIETVAPAVAGETAALPDSTPEPAVETEQTEPERLDTRPLPTEPATEPEPAIEREPAVEEPEAVTPAPAPEVATGDLVPLYQVDEPPTPLDQPRPSYPMGARRLNQEGTVVLNVLVDENGTVTEVELIRGVAEELDGAAIRAVRGWTYKPARKDGVDVKVWKPEKIVFKL